MREQQSKIRILYDHLMQMYGPQGWWPVSITDDHQHPTYHPNDHSYPHSQEQKFEICIGAILTQNTSWKNVEKAIANLKKKKLLSPEAIMAADDSIFLEAIRPSGYFNQKLKKARIFSEFFLRSKGTPKRDELLQLWGIGPETADSILLYAYDVPSFVIDAYTKRILLNLKIIKENMTYNELQELFKSNLKRDHVIYQEFHALIVEHAKRYYQKKENYSKDPLIKIFVEK